MNRQWTISNTKDILSGVTCLESTFKVGYDFSNETNSKHVHFLTTKLHKYICIYIILIRLQEMFSIALKTHAKEDIVIILVICLALCSWLFHTKFKHLIFYIERHHYCFGGLVCETFFLIVETFWGFVFVDLHPTYVIHIVVTIMHSINASRYSKHVSRCNIDYTFSELDISHAWGFGNCWVNPSIFPAVMITWVWNTWSFNNWHSSSWLIVLPSAWINPAYVSFILRLRDQINSVTQMGLGFYFHDQVIFLDNSQCIYCIAQIK